MNRIIKFRGKDLETGEWLYGNLIQRIGRFPGIMFSYEHGGKIHYCEQPVKQETVGQFTGLHDRNGKEVYEGDILRFNPSANGIGYVHWDKVLAQFVVILIADRNQWYCFCNGSEIVGNIYDNPELITEE